MAIQSVEYFKNIFANNKKEMAFICGNGINRYAYGNTIPCSWDDLLLELWKRISPKTRSHISKGITLTEFYEIMELETNKSADEVRKEFASLLEEWAPKDYHKSLLAKFEQYDIPLLTTNFDRNLDDGLTPQKLKLVGLKSTDFTDYYPWCVYFTKGGKTLSSPTNGFGIWHINGTLGYRRSIRLSLSEYINLSTRIHKYIFDNKSNSLYNAASENKSTWKGSNTWLDIIFHRSLCIFGLALDENETVLRWLLLQRIKYYTKFPKKRKEGWFICKKDEMTNGKRTLLDCMGFEIVELNDYKDIYENIFP